MDGILSNIRLLIVDDDKALRDALVGVFKTAGLQASVFSSAEELLGSPDLQTASCLILDMQTRLA